MMDRMSIRARLTVWYSTVLVLCLLPFGATVWLGLRQSLLEARQAELHDRITSLRTLLEQLGHAPTDGPDSLIEEVSEFSRVLPAGFSVWLQDSSNTVLFQPKSSPSTRAIEGVEFVRAGTRTLKVRMSLALMPDDEILKRLSHILFWSIPLAILAASAGGYWLSKRALSPVREMAMAAQSIDSSDLTLRLPVPLADDELRLLAGKWNEMLGRLQTSVDKTRRFTSDASHDLRTPLATIRASAEIALRKDREPEWYRDTLVRIVHQTDRATALVEDLLTLARADSGHVDLVLAPLDLSSLVGKVCESLRPLVHAKGIDLRQLLLSRPIWVNSNPDALVRVMTILVDNAVKNTEAGWIQVHVEEMDGEAFLNVEDTGTGIDPVDLAHIFDRFYRGDKARTSASGGSGLGLAIAKSLVEFLGGTIGVASERGKGTRCAVKLPRADPL